MLVDRAIIICQIEEHAMDVGHGKSKREKEDGKERTVL